MGGETSARSRSLYFVKEDEDGGEMREVTYGERGSARAIPIRVMMGRSNSPKNLKMFISSGFRAGRDSKAVMRRVNLTRGRTCLLILVCASPVPGLALTLHPHLIFSPMQSTASPLGISRICFVRADADGCIEVPMARDLIDNRQSNR